MNTINLRALHSNTNEDYPIWHPFSSLMMNDYNMLSIKRGEGIYLYDVDDKKYIDLASGLWNISLGYGNEKILKLIQEQLLVLPYCSMFENTNLTSIKFAKMLLELLPKQMKKIFFTCSGSESIELAIKVMRQYWHIKGKPAKSTIISLKDSYHGSYYASMSVSGIEQELLNEYAPIMGGVKFFKGAVCSKCESMSSEACNTTCLNSLESFIKDNANEIAGIIIEPILASKGVEVLSSDYLRGVQRLCTDYDILLTVDEVALGFYRTGYAFYTDSLNINPDIICMAKGINSGYLPIGAASISERICNAFSEQQYILNHGSTQGGNLLACAAGIAAIEQYIKLDIGQHVKATGKYFKQQLIKYLSKHKNIGEIRGEGFLIGIDLVRDKISNEYLNNFEIARVKNSLQKNGLITYRFETGLTLLPILIASKEEIDIIVDILIETFKHILF